MSESDREPVAAFDPKDLEEISAAVKTAVAEICRRLDAIVTELKKHNRILERMELSR